MIETELEIKTKYLKAPSNEEIRGFIKELGVGVIQFERFYNIPKRTLILVLGGHRGLPVKYWPIFYERKVPTYGLNWVKSNKKKVKSNKKKRVTPNVTGKDVQDDRLNKL
jgi:hypothetical protein